MNDRKGEYIKTFTGINFWPIDPRPEEIRIEDIAGALSKQCRFGGHTKRLYSVAEHCCSASRIVPKEHALAALLHDASEAYLVDVPRPIKKMLSQYRDIEAGLEKAIAGRFEIEYPWHAEVRLADDRLLTFEVENLLNWGWKHPFPDPWQSLPAMPKELSSLCSLGLSPNQAQHFFLARFEELTR